MNVWIMQSVYYPKTPNGDRASVNVNLTLKNQQTAYNAILSVCSIISYIYNLKITISHISALNHSDDICDVEWEKHDEVGLAKIQLQLKTIKEVKNLEKIVLFIIL